VLSGTYLAEDSAFGVFSFTRENTKLWSINAGIPCKWISNRKRKLLEVEKKFLAEKT